jgi:hypothetical protein
VSVDERVRRLADALNELGLYPEPLDPTGIEVLHMPRFFRVPRLRRFDGYATPWAILLRDPPAATSDYLLAHELCHVWQMRNQGARMPLSYLLSGYERNRYEREARWAGRRAAAAVAAEPV